jgi:hypothetical protein
MHKEDLITEFKNCIAKINVNGKVAGTGFFIAPGIIMTCIHLLIYDYEKYSYEELSNKIHEFKVSIEWNNKAYEAKVKDFVYYDETKLTRNFETLFIEIDYKDNPIALIDDKVPSFNDKCYVFGYPEGAFDLGDSISIKYTGDTPLKNSELYLLKFKDDLIKAGFSGSPILNMSSGKLCGMVVISLSDKQSLGGRGIPLALLDDKK